MLSQFMRVTWECDMRPAYYALLSGKQLINEAREFPIDPITDPGSIDSLGVFINGTPIWQFWRRDDLLWFRLFDDGTNGDVTSGDTIYTTELNYRDNNPEYLIGNFFRMSINGGDNEGGSGAKHMVNFDDETSKMTIRFAWGEVDPGFYSEWDYDVNHMTSIDPQPTEMLPRTFHLLQNYPNPFNSSTIINFQIPMTKSQTHVSLKIFNLLGQEVETLVDGEIYAGQHQYQWTAPSVLSSGIYWCELKAERIRDSIQLVLLK
jgi:hypothetical protein